MVPQNSEAASRLGVRHPIVQGPFGGGLSTAKLVATVANLGGLGSFGAHVVAPQDMGALAAEIRALTAQPFALNLWVSDHDPGGRELSPAAFDRLAQRFAPYFRELGLAPPEPPSHYHQPYDRQVEALLEARPPVFSFVFGVPTPEVLSECKRRGIVTMGTATTLAEARLLDEAGVDLIVATGMEAGGHRPSFLAPAEESLMGTFALTQLVAGRVKAAVVAAGGIACRRGMRAARELGADAVQLGTAFLACEESGASDEHRALLFSPEAEHTILTRAFTGRLARGIRNRFTEEMRAVQRELPPFPVQSWFVSQLKTAAASARRTDLVSLWAGQIAPNLHHRTATELMQSLLEET